MRQRRADGLGAEDALARLARQLRIKRQRQPVHHDLLCGQAIETCRRDGQPDGDRRLGCAQVNSGSHLCGGCIGRLRISIGACVRIQRGGHILKEARERLAEQLIDRERAHHADAGRIGVHDAAFENDIEGNGQTLCRQRVGKFVLHPTLQPMVLPEYHAMNVSAGNATGASLRRRDNDFYDAQKLRVAQIVDL